jgi:aldose 1-epimerase
MIGTREVDGIEALTLTSDAFGGIEAAFVPSAGMVGCSLRHRGAELLGQRGGLRTYIEERSTMGIPLLHPWANRVGRRRFEVAGREVNLDAAAPAPSLDADGLPIHGLLAAASGWRVNRHEATGGGGELVASFDFADHEGLIAAFPFPHRLRLKAALDAATLTVVTMIHASGDAPVPISFGYHPYLRLPDVDRADWEIEVPAHERLDVDLHMLPTGERQPTRLEHGLLGSRTFDDSESAPDQSAPFVLAGGGRRIELRVGSGYPFAQVYAPEDDRVIAYEPMTAPTNALVTGGPDLPLLEPGDRYEAIFSITVTDFTPTG